MGPLAEAGNLPIQTTLRGPASVYTHLMIDLVKHWPPKRLKLAEASEIPTLTCLSTENEKYYVGVEHFLKIQAPLERVFAVVSDVDHYQSLFPGFEQVKILEQNQNLWTILWEQTIPVFFIPNVKYETYYLIQREKNRTFIRMQLKNSTKINHTDGLITLESRGGATLYTEYDFFDADYGILKTLAPGRIWKDPVEAMFLSDLAVRFKSENPGLSYADITKKTKAVLAKFPLEAILKKRESAQSLK